MFPVKIKTRTLYHLVYCVSQQVAMRALGFEVKKVDVLKILKDYDREGNGKITFEDFNEVGKFVFNLNLSAERYCD